MIFFLFNDKIINNAVKLEYKEKSYENSMPDPCRRRRPHLLSIQKDIEGAEGPGRWGGF